MTTAQRGALTYDQLAERWRTSPGALRQRVLRDDPMPPSFVCGRRRLFPEPGVMAFEEEQVRRDALQRSERRSARDRFSRVRRNDEDLAGARSNATITTTATAKQGGRRGDRT